MTTVTSNGMSMHYIIAIPRQLPEGTVLVHNNVIPQRWFNSNGFRAWTQDSDDDHIEVCDCDWAGVDLHGLTHYRVKGPGLNQK